VVDDILIKALSFELREASGARSSIEGTWLDEGASTCSPPSFFI
jgi:hypothetical protein